VGDRITGRRVDALEETVERLDLQRVRGSQKPTRLASGGPEHAVQLGLGVSYVFTCGVRGTVTRREEGAEEILSCVNVVILGGPSGFASS